MKNSFLAILALAAFCPLSPAWADSSVTRTLNASPGVSAGEQVVVENLVGHMTVSQGDHFKVTASVIANGSQAQTVAQSMKLDVTTTGNRITVHVDYPVNEHDSYLYVTNRNNDQHCVLNIVCFRGEGESNFNYQGKRVHVYRGANTGVPLHVDVVVTIPAGVHAKFVNDVGLLEASDLANPLTLDAAGGDVYAHKLTGHLMADTQGGDLRVNELEGNLQASTDGGDVYLSQSTGNDMHLETGGGDVHVSNVMGSLDANTGGGDLYVTRYTSGGKVSLNTGGGNVHFSADLAAARDLEAILGGGDGVFRISHLSMHLEVISGGGDVSAHLPDATNVDSNHNHYSADVGQAQGRGSILAGGGNISIATGSGK